MLKILIFSLFVFAGTQTIYASTAFPNPLGDVTTVSALTTNILNNLKTIIATIAIVMIVVGGLMYILSGGEEKNVTRAKSIITAACIGLAIVLAAPSFLQEIYTILGTSATDSSVSSAVSLQTIAHNVLVFLLSIVGIIGMIGLVVGGAFYLTAYGDEERIKKGKSIITGSLIGIAIAMAALVLVKQISALIG